MFALIRLLREYRSRWFRRYMRSQKAAKIITIIIFCAVLFGVAFGIFEFFRWELTIISHDAYLRVALPLYLYENLFLIVFILVFLSAFIGGMFALFKGGDDALVMSSPRFMLVFWKSYWRTLVSSLWPIVVMTIPAFLGSSVVLPITVWGGVLFIIAICLLDFLGVTAAFIVFLTASALLFIISRIFNVRLITFGRAALASSLLVVLALWGTWARVGAQGDILRLFAPTVGSVVVTSRVDIIISRFRIFPSHLATLALLGGQTGTVVQAAIAVIGLILFAVVAGIALVSLLSVYLPLWQVFQEGRFEAAAAAMRMRMGPAAFPRAKTALGALFEKEALMFVREMKGLFWFFFLFFLWAVQIGLEFFIRANLLKYGVDLAKIIAQVESLELVTAIYFMGAFILRFAYPSFSGELKKAWILGTAPLSVQKIFWAKFFFYSAVFLFLGAMFCGVNFAIIQLPFSQALAFIVFALLMVALLVAYGLGLGAMFPDFDTDDPELLSTSLPGLAFIFGSLLYGGFGSYLFYKFLSGGSVLPLAAFDVLTAAIAFIVLRLTMRSLDAFEFVRGD